MSDCLGNVANRKGQHPQQSVDDSYVSELTAERCQPTIGALAGFLVISG